MRGLQVSNLVAHTFDGKHWLSFDVSLSGHLISTISVEIQDGSLLWQGASIEGFEDFQSSEQRLMEAMIKEAIVHQPGSVRAH